MIINWCFFSKIGLMKKDMLDKVHVKEAIDEGAIEKSDTTSLEDASLALETINPELMTQLQKRQHELLSSAENLEVKTSNEY
jgi:hypothetical protein